MSVAEIFILEREISSGIFQQRNNCLQVITFLATDSQLVSLNRGLHLDFAALDFLDELPGKRCVEAPAHNHLLPRRTASQFRFLFFETANIDTSL
jgi:hypothetical protein